MIDGDTFQKFMFDSLHVRGELVRLGSSYRTANSGKSQPGNIRKLLAETTAASILMTGTLKFEGRLSVHARGRGPVTLIMSEATHQQDFRSIAHFEEPLPDTDDLRMLLGEAQLAITIEPEKGQRYQGIVPLEHAKLSECLASYFQLSEQLDTYFLFGSDDESCFGLMLQKLPDYKFIEDQDAWDRLVQLAETLSFDELSSHDNMTILHRLFHEEALRLFDSKPVNFSCTCSAERSLASIEALGQEEALSILNEEPVIAIDCQFCGQHYEFDRDAVNQLFGMGKAH